MLLSARAIIIYIVYVGDIDAPAAARASLGRATTMMQKATSVLVMLVVQAASRAHGHGLMLTPPARSAGDGLLHRGGSMWYTQSTTIGCSKPNITVDVHTSMHAGDLCPNDNSGTARGMPKVPTLNATNLRTWLAQGCFDDDGQVAPCTDANEHTDWTKFHPWRAPGNAPVYDSWCASLSLPLHRSYVLRRPQACCIATYCVVPYTVVLLVRRPTTIRKQQGAGAFQPATAKVFLVLSFPALSAIVPFGSYCKQQTSVGRLWQIMVVAVRREAINTMNSPVF